MLIRAKLLVDQQRFCVLTRRNSGAPQLLIAGGVGARFSRGRTHYFVAFGGNLMTYTHGSRILKQKKREGTG